MSRPHPAINDTATDIEIAPIPKGVLLTYGLINELTGEYQRRGRTLSAIEAETVINQYLKDSEPPRPREFWIMRKGDKSYSHNHIVRFFNGELPSDHPSFDEMIHVKEVVPEPKAKEWWFVKTRYDGPWWRRCDEKQSDPENHKTQIHVREIP